MTDRPATSAAPGRPRRRLLGLGSRGPDGDRLCRAGVARRRCRQNSARDRVVVMSGRPGRLPARRREGGSGSRLADDASLTEGAPLFACIVILAVLGRAINLFFHWLGRRLAGWAR